LYDGCLPGGFGCRRSFRSLWLMFRVIHGVAPNEKAFSTQWLARYCQFLLQTAGHDSVEKGDFTDCWPREIKQPATGMIHPYDSLYEATAMQQAGER